MTEFAALFARSSWGAIEVGGWAMLVPVAFILGVYVLVLAICGAASRGDRMWEQARRDRFDRWPL